MTTRGRRATSVALLVASLLFAACVPVSLALHFDSARLFTHTVGVFVVLAELLRDGVLYPSQPTLDLVYSAFYHPLAFAPLALLPGSGVGMLPALRMLVGGELILCLVVTGVLARGTGLRGMLTWQPPLWALCTVPVTFCLLGMRDDPRAVLFALLAILVYVRGRRFAAEAAGLLLVIAFMTKATAPAAPGLALSWAAWQRGGAPEAMRLWLTCALGTAAAVAVLQWGLGADFLGNGLYYAVFAPAKEPRTWAETFGVLGRDLGFDGALPALLGVSLITTIVAVARRRAGFWEILVLAAWLKTIVAYRSVGTELNHLLDLTLFAAVQVASRLRPWLTPGRALAVLAGMLLLAVPRPFTTLFPFEGTTPLAESAVAQKAAVLHALTARNHQRVLVEEPLLAWEAGTRPLVTDPLLTFATLQPFPEIRRIWFGPANVPGALQMLVLMRNPFDADADTWYGPIHFDRQFLAEVRAHWKVVATDDHATVLVRKDP